MKAWRTTTLGQPADVLELVDVPEPSPGPGQAVVRVEACALGFPDVLMCRGDYQQRPPMPFSPGGEVYGRVVAVGPGSTLQAGVVVGSSVIALGSGLHGGLAELALVDADLAFPAPPRLDPAAAAALYGTYLTGWLALHHRARLQTGEVLLVQAAAGGVGSAVVQLGLAAGARVVGVVRGPAKAAAVRAAGAELVLDRLHDDVVEAVRGHTGGHGADVLVDPVGGDAWRECTRSAAFEARLLPIGFAGGEIPTQRLNHPLLKGYTILGMSSGTYVARRPDLVARAHRELYDLAQGGVVEPVVGERVPFAGAPRALQELGAGGVIGRSVVLVGG